MAIGDPIPFEELADNRGRKEMVSELRRRTYELAETLDSSAENQQLMNQEYPFPKHFNL
ncbi:MAG: hypothetical protein ACRBM6_21370 [Geminicoccales bacterium]